MFKLKGSDSFLKSLSQKDRAVFVLCGILGVICSLLLTPYFDDSLEFYNSNSSNEPVIGKITHKTNTVQVKNYQQMIWQNAKKNQDIRTGDSVFSGEKSLTQIQINNSNKIVLGENSLILFQVIKSDKVANLKDGNFKISVNGDIKVAIDGKLAQIKGDKSEIQVFLSSDNKPLIKVLTGSATVTDENGAKQDLTEGSITQFNPQPTVETAISIPQPNEPKSKLNYTWKLFDLYERNEDGTYQAKKSLPTAIKLEKKLDWTLESENQNAVIEFSGQMDFSDKKTFSTNQNSMMLSELFVGANYWRVRHESSDQWSAVAEFELQTTYKGQTSLEFVSYDREVPLFNNKAESKIKLQNQKNHIGYLMESSTHPDFSTANSRLLITSGQFPVFYETTGTYYYRLRSVNENQEISEWSPVFKIQVYTPELPVAPTLKMANSQVTLPDEVLISWDSEEQKVFTEIRNENNQLVKRHQGDTLQDRFEPGKYVATAYAMDEFGRISAASTPVPISVAEASNFIAADRLQKNNADQSIALDLLNSGSSSNFYNASYKESKFSINTFMWNLFSSQQLANNSATPAITGIGANILHWFGQNGVAGQIKNGLSSSTGSQTSLSSVEAKYHHRFNTTFAGADELQLSLFTGIEAYRNSGNSVFSNKYEIIKAGVNMNLPIRETWSGGGEIALGYGLDSSKKYELSGEMNHYFNKLWSLGLSYKVHLFEAGSTSSSGNGTLPYREGYTESSLLINYDY